MSSFHLYAGAYTNSHALSEEPEQSIFYYQFNPQTGHLSLEGVFDGGPNLTYLTLSMDGRFLYTVNDVASYQGQTGGSVSAFSVDQRNGSLIALNTQSSHGATPCFVSLDDTEKLAMVANYQGGNISFYPVLSNGHLDLASNIIQHEGRGPNSQRQEKSHPHSIQTDPSNRFVLAADLGIDQVKLYQFDPTFTNLRLFANGAIPLHPGAGPRHLDFHPTGKWMYVLNELDATLVVFEVEMTSGSFTI